MTIRFSRRRLLVGSSLVLWPGLLGAAPRALRNGEILPDPDFTALRETNPYIVGVRPHRKGGVRLELDRAPLESPTGPKYVVHNYGHGGAGITLSWGCASVATDLVATVLPKLKVASIAVLGTGVIGLTVATELKRRWPQLAITVYAKDLALESTTSFIAGGQFEPSGIYREYDSVEGKEVLGSYLRKARDRIVGIQRSGQRELFGVAERMNYTLEHENKAFDSFIPSDVIAAHRKGTLPFAKLNEAGREYSTWLLNPTILLPKLAKDLAEGGVAFKQRELTSVGDVTGLPQNVIINCTGYGAKKLFGDERLVGQRGHLVVLKKTDPKQFYFFSGGCMNPAISYVFCRQDDIVVGGTVLSGNDSTQVTDADSATFARLISNGSALFSGQSSTCKVG